MASAGYTNMDIINARLPGSPSSHWLHLGADGAISTIAPMTEYIPTPGNQPVLDVAGDWISLGGVDLQINGALGLAFPDLQPTDEDRLAEICTFLWHQGVDAFVPTIVTTNVSNIHRSLSTIGEFMRRPPIAPGAKVLGVHLEGPFLNWEKRGAHPEEHLLPLNMENVKRVLGDYGEVVRKITLAPELDRSGDVIPYLRSLGIWVSLGHSQAKANEANRAFDLGATMVTHAFNAMPSLHHREPGLLGAAIVRKGVYCGAIADGEHVCPPMLELLLRASGGSKGVFLVSDALAPLGLPDGVYPWDTRQIEVKNGTARLFDGTLSGTTLPLLDGVRNLVQWGICEVGEAIGLATESPRHALGLPGLTVGQPATQFLRWHLDPSTSSLSWQRLA
ncbi:MAG: N-acetylglucosamine-6-phosphate deacetylase [Oscillatoriaceae cyanobacterium]